jgi:hypothetical protein
VTERTFDELAKRLGSATSRRGMLKGALALAVGGVAARLRGSQAAAATARQACGRLSQTCGAGLPACCPGMTCDAGVCHKLDNQSCYADDDCSGLSTCRPNPHGLGMRCLPPAGLGESCTDDSDCGAQLACAKGVCSPAIGNMASWDGINYIGNFGYPITSTYGQPIVIPAGVTMLETFSFQLRLPPALIFRGEVYAWDAANNRATGPALWESPQMHTTDGSVFEKTTFVTGGVPVTPGQMYIVFATTERDVAVDMTAGTGVWGQTGIDVDTYPAATFVYTDGTGWTSSSWTTYGPPIDLAFEVSFSI